MRTRRYAYGVAATLLALTAGCTSSSDGPTDPTTTTPESTGVPESEIEVHEAASGSPIAFGIDVPDGAVHVGPVISQRTADVGPELDPDLEGSVGQTGASGGPTDLPTDGETDVPTEDEDGDEDVPEFTTALMRIDGDPGETISNTLDELAEAFPDNDVRPDDWAAGCRVADGLYTYCSYQVTGITSDGQPLRANVDVNPGDVATRTAPAGSLLRPVMVLTLEALDEQTVTDLLRDGTETTPSTVPSPTPSETGEPGADASASVAATAAWPAMDTERASSVGSDLLTPEWRVQPDTTVILSTERPKVALLALGPEAEADTLARRYVAKFADPGTTPVIDEIEDRNELSTTYTPRNSGDEPGVVVTSIRTARGDYLELVYADPVRTGGSPSADARA